MREVFSPHPFGFGVQPFFWWDAGDIHERVLNGGDISDGLDKSGNGENAVQATGADQPLLDVAAQNGRDTWKGDGVSQHLDCSVVLPDEASIFMCFDGDNSYADDYVLSGDGAGGTPAFIVGFTPVATKYNFEFFDGTTRGVFSQSATGFHVCAIAQDDTTVKGYFDGVEVFSIASTPFAGGSLVSLMSVDSIQFYEGSFCEGFGLPKKCQGWEMQQGSQYLMNRWGV